MNKVSLFSDLPPVRAVKLRLVEIWFSAHIMTFMVIKILNKGYIIFNEFNLVLTGCCNRIECRENFNGAPTGSDTSQMI